MQKDGIINGALRENPQNRRRDSRYRHQQRDTGRNNKPGRGITRHDLDDERLYKWQKVGTYWECPVCETGVSSITGTQEGDYVVFRLCPICGVHLSNDRSERKTHGKRRYHHNNRKRNDK